MDDFWLVWGPFGGQKLSKAPSKKGSIFQGKKGCQQKRKKTRPRGYADHWREYFGGPRLLWGVGGKQPNKPKCCFSHNASGPKARRINYLIISLYYLLGSLAGLDWTAGLSTAGRRARRPCLYGNQQFVAYGLLFFPVAQLTLPALLP